MPCSTDKLVQVGNLTDFWFQVNASRNILLALDYDGTLAPFHIDPMQAYPLPGIAGALFSLNKVRYISVAVISGRPVREVFSLLGDIGITFVGCHGFESMDVDGNIAAISPSPLQSEGIEDAVRMAGRYGFKGKMELKTGSIALHTRGMPADEALKIEEQVFRDWSQLRLFDLRCRRFNGGVEIYCTGRNKADALGDLIAGRQEGTLTVYIGDDTTDEDAFRMLRETGTGIGIKVGTLSETTAARGFLPDCEGVRAFLQSWLSFLVCERQFSF